MSLMSRIGSAWGALSGKSADGSLELFREIYGSRPSHSGQVVNRDTALQVSTVFACLRVLADGIAQAPLKLYRTHKDGKGADPATDHPLYDVLYRQPNPWQTSFAFRETLMFHAALCGNFYAFINRVRGKIVELIPIEPHRVMAKQNFDYTLTYTVTGLNGSTAVLSQDLIWHVRGPSWNTWCGLEIVKVAREAIGLAKAIETDQSKLYKNGVRTSGTYSFEGSLKEEQYKQLRKFIKDFQQDESGGPLILDRSAKWLQQQMTGVDAQTLESRRNQVEEICREFRVMPIMVGHSDKTATYASAEQMFIAHAVHTLAPWCERLEHSIDNDLIGDAPEDADVYAKFNLSALMRGSMVDQSTMFSKALGAGGVAGWMTQNEVRALLDMNPLPGGDELPKPSARSGVPLEPDGTPTVPIPATPQVPKV